MLKMMTERENGEERWELLMVNQKSQRSPFEKAAFELRLEEKEELVIRVRNKKKNTPDKKQELEQSLWGSNLVCFNPP